MIKKEQNKVSTASIENFSARIINDLAGSGPNPASILHSSIPIALAQPEQQHKEPQGEKTITEVSRSEIKSPNTFLQRIAMQEDCVPKGP